MNNVPVKLYALSTCGWCRKTREFLDRNGVEYEICYVDLLEGDERNAAVAEVKNFNPRGSYPTIVRGDLVIAGYDEGKLQDLVAR